MVTRYDIFRKRIAPVAMVVAVALIAREQCGRMKRTHATVVLDFGGQVSRVRDVRAEVTVGEGESAAMFHREAHPPGGIGTCKFELALPVEDARLTVDTDVDGKIIHVDRGIHLDEGATITIKLESAIAP